jgi:hypothetical protein
MMDEVWIENSFEELMRFSDVGSLRYSREDRLLWATVKGRGMVSLGDTTPTKYLVRVSEVSGLLTGVKIVRYAP